MLQNEGDFLHLAPKPLVGAFAGALGKLWQPDGGFHFMFDGKARESPKTLEESLANNQDACMSEL